MRTKIIWQCHKCGFKMENNIGLIMEHGEPVCICGEHMVIEVELEQGKHPSPKPQVI